ncbi:hypothetical protein PF003_g11937 [Phytophthora fragariae]|nr:hypothetical protein PF003_g11937 [Phytophthora fragariae]
MPRRQEQLYVQRRQLVVQPRQDELRRDVEAQWAERQRRTTRVDDWWKLGDDADETRRDSTCWNTSSEQWDGRAMVDDVGSRGTNTIDCCTTVGSWKTPQLRKSCNRTRLPTRTRVRASGVERNLAGGGGPQLAAERNLSTHAFPGYGQVQSTPAFPGYVHAESTPAFADHVHELRRVKNGEDGWTERTVAADRE